jgi:hypothetical protein
MHLLNFKRAVNENESLKATTFEGSNRSSYKQMLKGRLFIFTVLLSGMTVGVKMSDTCMQQLMV